MFQSVRKNFLQRMRQIDIRNYEWGAAAASALLLILAFPNFEYYQLAWIGLVPLLVVIGRRPAPLRAFILGWAVGSVFFYVTCYWLTYSMIHYGGLPTALAYLLLIPGAIVVGIFHGLFAALIALAIQKWGRMTVMLAPIFWITLEWVRLGVTGQLWNALGYSQAFHPWLIQPANWGGVYAVSFLIVTINSIVALLIISRTKWSILLAVSIALVAFYVIEFSRYAANESAATGGVIVYVVAVQPNVPMNTGKSSEEIKALIDRHLSLSTEALKSLPSNTPYRLVVWPESPMNFSYASDKSFQELVANFTRENHTSLIFNSLEPAPNDGSYNSALLINEEGQRIAQYDKIRLMPFGEYVPLPQWLPGASLISGIVGEFTPGSKYTLMPFGDNQKAGVFICIESAYPSIARQLTYDGAGVLINISNDGYLGPTAVMRQHLSNAIFRAVENGRPVMRVTNTGLSAWITEHGRIENITEPFQADVRLWVNHPSFRRETIYTRKGDLFVHLCAVISAIIFVGAVVDRITRFTR
ncbi:MAG: apolipoprotein N-acyltransferase [Acidobacteriota bacterium]|jgi:apolipoprotein N-acyltransferase